MGGWLLGRWRICQHPVDCGPDRLVLIDLFSIAELDPDLRRVQDEVLLHAVVGLQRSRKSLARRGDELALPPGRVREMGDELPNGERASVTNVVRGSACRG